MQLRSFKALMGLVAPYPLNPQMGHLIQGIKTGNYAGWDAVRVMVEPKWHHSCQLCGLEVD